MQNLALKLLTGSIVFLLTSSLAFAQTSIVCGQTAQGNPLQISGFELEVSAQTPADYEGIVGEKWNLKLVSPESPWLRPNPNIMAQTFQDDMGPVIEITIFIEDAATGPMGEVYRLYDLSKVSPVLEKHNFGGYTGEIMIGLYQCAHN